MQLKCNECPHVEWDDGGFCGPDTRSCTYGGKTILVTYYTRCPIDLEAAREEADRLYPDRSCEECFNYDPRVDMGWSHADVTDLCWLTRTRKPTRGIEGCIFRPLNGTTKTSRRDDEEFSDS